MTGNEKCMEITKPNILYFGPCALRGGVEGGARLKNMIDVLGQLQANTQLISYLPAEKFGVSHEQINNHSNITAVSVKRTSPKFLKVLALGLIFVYGLRHIKKSNIILAHSPGIASGLPAFVLAKMFNKPFVIDHMDIKDPDTPRFIYNSVLKNSNIVFAISRFLEEEAKRIGCQKAVYVPVFIDADVFQKDTLRRMEIREKLGIGDEEIVIGYAGAFAPDEGLPFLLKAFKRLSKRYNNTKLVLVGGRNVPGSDDILQLANEPGLKERVIFVPPQPHELMPGYLSAFDIACSPKVDCAVNRAANPIKIYEYMSMGLPTIISAVDETSNVIENGYDGFLAKPGDEDDLERVLGYVIENLDSAKEAGERAREKIIKNYTQQVLLGKIRQALIEISNNAPWASG